MQYKETLQLQFWKGFLTGVVSVEAILVCTYVFVTL